MSVAVDCASWGLRLVFLDPLPSGGVMERRMA